MLLVWCIPVIFHTSGVDAVVHLLCDHRLVRRELKVVTTTTELLEMVILRSHLTVDTCLEISSHSEGLSVHLGELCEAVTIVVISVLLSVLTKDCDSHLVVVSDK